MQTAQMATASVHTEYTEHICSFLQLSLTERRAARQLQPMAATKTFLIKAAATMQWHACEA